MIPKTTIDKISFYQKELQNLVQNRTKDAIVRSRAQWAESGEKHTKYFLNVEKRNCDRKSSMNENVAKVLIKQIKKILAELVDYCKQLYSGSNCTKSQINDFDKYKIKAKLYELTENHKLICDAPNTLEECKNSLKQLLTNKPPLINGFTTKVFKAFWNDIKNASLIQLLFLSISVS